MTLMLLIMWFVNPNLSDGTHSIVNSDQNGY